MIGLWAPNAFALHAMATLQVHQAKELRDIHEGNQALMLELHLATDLALWAMKVTILCRAMSTLVVQERHLLHNLAKMREAKKVCFLDATTSQAELFGVITEQNICALAQFGNHLLVLRTRTLSFHNRGPSPVPVAPAPPQPKPAA